MIIAQGIPDPTTVIDNANRFGWQSGLLAFISVTFSVFALWLIMQIWRLYRDVTLRKTKKSEEMMDRIGSSVETVSHVMDEQKDCLHGLYHSFCQHDKTAEVAVEYLKQNEGRHSAHRDVHVLACEGLREYLQDEAFPEGKDKYLRYIDEIEKIVRNH